MSTEAQVNYLSDLLYSIYGHRLSPAKREEIHTMTSHRVSRLIEQAKERHGARSVPRLTWPPLSALPPDPRVASIDVARNIPSQEEIDSARTSKGAWTRAQLAEWGVPWPPPRGWRDTLRVAWEKQQEHAPMALREMT